MLSAVPRVQNIRKILGAQLFCGDEELAAAQIAEHDQLMFLALGVGGDVADDLEQQRVVFLQLGLIVARVKLLKARVSAL